MHSPIWPLFVFLDDMSLEICESLTDARREYEGIDVEAGSYSFYDFTGRPLKPVFVKPNQRYTLIGKVYAMSSGVFDFVISTDAEHEPITTKLQDTYSLSKNSRFSSLDDILRHLRA